MKKTVCYFLGILIPILLLTSCESAKNTSMNTSIASIPFELTAHNNISIKALLNEQDTLNLMFHTAAGSLTLIRSRTEYIENIDWSEEQEVESWGGESKAKYSESNSLRIGDLTWDSLPIWENENSGPGTDGKFGPNLFKDQVIEIDFDESVINIYRSLPKKTKNYKMCALTYTDGFMFIEGTSKVGSKVHPNKFLIHSGFGGSILYDDKFVETNKLSEQLKVISEKELKDSYGNVLKTKKAVLPLFTIGGEEFRDMPVGFFEGSIGRQQMSVIGGDLLKRFNMIIDSERKHIYLKPNGFKKYPFTS